jgi:hypothetical protein
MTEKNVLATGLELEDDFMAASKIADDCHGLLHNQIVGMMSLCSHLEKEVTRLSSQIDILQQENELLRKSSELSMFSNNSSLSLSSTPASPKKTNSKQSSPNGSLRIKNVADVEMKQRLYCANLLNQTQAKQYEFEIKKISLDRDMAKAQLERDAQQKASIEKDRRKFIAQQREFEQTIEKLTSENKILERKFKNLERQRAELSALLQTEEKNAAKLNDKILKQAHFHKKEVERILQENRAELQALSNQHQEELEQERRKARKELEKLIQQHQRIEDQYHQETKLKNSLKKELETVTAEKKSSLNRKRSMTAIPRMLGSLTTPTTPRPKLPPFK